MRSGTWKAGLARWLEAVLPRRLYWVVLAVVHIRRGYLHEADFHLFGLLDGLDFLVADIGAHRGESAIAILSACTSARVVSFEPNPEATFALSWIRLRFPRRFRWRRCAVADRPGQAQLHIPASGRFRHTPSASLNPREFDKDYVRERFRNEAGGARYSGCSSQSVRVTRLDDTGIFPDVIKIDVEGSETAVLRGARNLLTQHAPLLMIELNNHERFLPLLESLGYRLFRFDSRAGRLTELADDEHPLNIFALSPKSRSDFHWRLLPGGRFPAPRPMTRPAPDAKNRDDNRN